MHGSFEKFRCGTIPNLKVISTSLEDKNMGFGKGALLWLIGIPLPIILLLAIFMHH